MPSPHASKDEWRRWLRARNAAADEASDRRIVAGLRTFIENPIEGSDASATSGRGAAHSQLGHGLILFYRAMPNELSLDPLADELGWHRFAVTRTPESGPLSLRPAVGPSEMHRYGFSQPTADAPELEPRHISMALVPGLAFDRHGTRLGHGAGYFDELLARLPHDCPRVGIAPAELVFARLPCEPHDIPMTHLATEAGVRRVSASSD